jgi:hypothetical protein
LSYQQVVPRTTRLIVVTSPGFTGYERLVSYELAR